jgi:NAD(P)-dependent dehydrogenase (short-subunit alcohol dehydrogenase family)
VRCEKLGLMNATEGPIAQGRVAVVTGAASGIGLAMANRFAAAGMNLVMADIETGALDAAVAEVESTGVAVASMRCDVSQEAEVGALADLAYERFGGAHVVCNNAGVVTRHEPWGSLEDWKWVIDIDLWGVIYGVHHFLPRMLASGEPGHVINTASTAGLLAFPGIASYNVAKRGVVALSETMHHELAGTAVGVSVLCPGVVATRIGESARNRPGHAVDSSFAPSRGAAESITADDVAEQVADAVATRRFWILTHPHYGDQALEHANQRVAGGDPVIPQIQR